MFEQTCVRSSLAVHLLRNHASTAGDKGLISGWWTEILRATGHSQSRKNKKQWPAVVAMVFHQLKTFQNILLSREVMWGVFFFFLNTKVISILLFLKFARHLLYATTFHIDDLIWFSQLYRSGNKKFRVTSDACLKLKYCWKKMYQLNFRNHLSIMLIQMKNIQYAYKRIFY